MRLSALPLLFASFTVAVANAQELPSNLILVEGGVFQSSKSNYHGKDVTVSSFRLGRYEVTQKEWTDVMGENPSHFKGDTLPVEMVSWYESIEYCNRRSLKEGLQPYYTIDKQNRDTDNDNDLDDVKWTVTINEGANGYRLPTEAEWEYAATGGRHSKGQTYSGGNSVDGVAWYWRNAGDQYLMGLWNWPLIEANHNRTKPVGGKAPNELGLHDMSGNVREWCWDRFGEIENPGADPRGSRRGGLRVWKGGGWLGDAFCCEPRFRASYEAHSRGYDQGFRVCRSP